MLKMSFLVAFLGPFGGQGSKMLTISFRGPYKARWVMRGRLGSGVTSACAKKRIYKATGAKRSRV